MSNLTYGAPAINRKNKRGVAVFIHAGGKVEYARDGQMMKKDKSGHELNHNYPSLPKDQSLSHGLHGPQPSRIILHHSP